ncbi:MAG: tRNA uridine-5-carboxymethylaminomethyl(34) synthesis enzyme MnmG [Clostridiales bacterium]|nr:MAG: tRNA uridine-5-carboxymethylaminomethyl(34) synthesis enzyme MnmG [Clostridiales bacterium]
MRKYELDEYDIIVVGAGHAGCEAGLSSARLGKRTLMLAINLDSVAMMPCNPSVGGTGKAHLVREIDALGGEMAINTDKTLIQMKTLNTKKGPAVHSLRAQSDKMAYHIEMKKTIESQENLELKEAEVVELIIEDNVYKGVVTSNGGIYRSKKLILATGTYLSGLIYIGDGVTESGPCGLRPANKFAKHLRNLGFDMRRFKTGTPARVNAKSVCFDNMKVEKGDENPIGFSFMTDELSFDEKYCYLTYTNKTTHDIINENYKLSAMYSGLVEGVGPRYCPSIEDKVIRFADRERHQIFVEPEGDYTGELYIQGMSSSLPEDIQHKFMKTIVGLENCEIMRPAHAIEYDCINPLSLKSTLEHKEVKGIYFAGQINGSSGYEEAGCQGLMAGINAVRSIEGKSDFVLDRSEAYIGVLIDDLVTKGTNEPYRIMTGRCEYRLLLRQDNADLRLTEKGREIGLVDDVRYSKFVEKKEQIEKELNRLKTVKVKKEDLKELFEKYNYNAPESSYYLSELLLRPEITYDEVIKVSGYNPNLNRYVKEQCEIMIKYSGYIEKQIQQVNKFKSFEEKLLPEDVDYEKIDNLRLEARTKLNKLKPRSLGQASRISGVSPSDISVLMVWLERGKR